MQSQRSKERERRIHRSLLRQIQLNSDAMGNPQILHNTSTLNLEQKEGEVWQAHKLISPTFIDD